MICSVSVDGLCRVCAGPTHFGFAVCYCCSVLIRQLHMPLTPVVAVADYRIGDEMHRHLRGYKDAPVGEARRGHVEELTARIDDWLACHRGQLPARFGSGWDVIATVPSSCRPRGAPVDALVSGVGELRRRWEPLLIRGGDTTDHLVASRHGFEVAASVDRAWLRRRSVLVVDDTIITGARAQSAAAALRLNGAAVAGILVVGRGLAPLARRRPGLCPPRG
jgi:adenine/guanine phosphoribosyltransferase-like PRPP-binding protein